jgi:hypothetical protein
LLQRSALADHNEMIQQHAHTQRNPNARTKKLRHITAQRDKPGSSSREDRHPSVCAPHRIWRERVEREIQRECGACSAIPLEEVGLDGVDHLAELACKTRDEQAMMLLMWLAATRDDDETQQKGSLPSSAFSTAVTATAVTVFWLTSLPRRALLLTIQ